MLKNKIYSNKTKTHSLDKIRNSPEYMQNQMQIDCITKVLVEHSDVPPQLIDWLIESVQKNVLLEHEIL